MGFLKSKEFRILWPFYMNQLTISVFFMIMPFWIIFFNDAGLTFKQISILLAISFISPIIFEIPTGAFADAFGRKFSVIFGDFFWGTSIFLIPFMKSYLGFIILFLFWGIFASFSSGADDAWVIDLLKSKKQNKLIHNYFIKMRSVASFGGIISGILGALLVKHYGLDVVWYVTGIAIWLGTILLLISSEEHFKKKKYSLNKLAKETYNNFKGGVNYTIKHPVLLYLVLAGFFFFLSVMTSIAWQPYFRDVGVPIYSLGYIFSAGGLVASGLPFLSKPLLKRFKKEKYYLASLVMLYILLAFSIYFIFSSTLAIIVFLLGVIPFELMGPVESTYFQRFIPSKIRASVGSFKSMIIGLSAAVSFLIGGYLVDLVGPQMTIVYSGFLVIPAFILYLMVKK